jgi:spore maturation protein CgeB
MRVGVIGPTGRERFAEVIAETLRGMGFEVVQLGAVRIRRNNVRTTQAIALTLQAFPHLERAVQRRIARAALAAGCELVINVEPGLMPETVAQLKQAGVRVVFWFPDPVISFGRSLMLIAPYDALFFKEPHLVDRLRATTSLPVHYLPEACSPAWHRPAGPAGTEPFLVLAGNMYPSRLCLLEQLMARGIPLRLYGPPFPRWIGDTPVRAAHTGRRIYYADKAKVYRSAAGVLNSLHPAEMCGVNARLFEAAGCGAAVLTEFRPAVPGLFKTGEEVLVYHDLAQLVDQASRLLTEAGLTARLGDAAARRAHRDHTYQRRLTTILETVL